MKITAVKTPIVKLGDDLLKVISKNIKEIPEDSVLMVTSKIISYAQGRLIPIKTNTQEEKHELVRQEADWYLPNTRSKYNLLFAIKNGHLAVNAGIDESNADDNYILWPENLQQVTNEIWQFVRSHYQVKRVGVIVTDSRTWPLRWGVVGSCLTHCGFKQLHDYRGKPDLFGREIHFVQFNIAEAVASASALEMGEVAEQTPLGIVENIKLIEFQDQEPTKQELADLIISPADDMYEPLLTSVTWKKGGGGIDLSSRN